MTGNVLPSGASGFDCSRLHRDRSAVKRDVDEMERAGLVTITEKVLPGHGRMKEVRVVANRFRLQADIA